MLPLSAIKAAVAHVPHSPVPGARLQIPSVETKKTCKSKSFLFGGEGPLSSFLEFFVYIDCKDDLLLHRGYKLEDLYVYNNLY